jgi:hypothetical protein
MKGAAPVPATRWIAGTRTASAADGTNAGVREKRMMLVSYQALGMKSAAAASSRTPMKAGVVLSKEKRKAAIWPRILKTVSTFESAEEDPGEENEMERKQGRGVAPDRMRGRDAAFAQDLPEAERG